jgi:hypothetical protein
MAAFGCSRFEAAWEDGAERVITGAAELFAQQATAIEDLSSMGIQA